MPILIYNIPLIFLWLFVSKLLFRDQNRQNNFFLIICGFQLFFFHAFKDWNSLPDLPVYEQMFKDLSRYGEVDRIDERMELGFQSLLRGVSFFSHRVIFLSCITSLLIIGIYFYTIKKYSKIVWLSVFLYLFLPYLQSLFVLRQHIAVAICLLAIPFILNRKIIPFILIIGLACTFHKSAIIFIPSYFIYNIDINKKNLFILCIFIVFLFFLKQFLISQVQHFDAYYYNVLMSKEGLANFIPVIITLLIIVLSLFLINIKTLVGFDKLAFFMCCSCFIIALLGIGVAGVGRLAWYYTIFVIFWIPNLMSYIRFQERLFLIPIILFCYSLFFFNSIFYSLYFKNFKLIL